MAFQFAVMLIGVAVIGLIYYFGAERRLKRRLRKLPISSSIALTPENQDVRVSGMLAYVEGKAPLTAPISGRPCVAWRVLVEVKKSNGKSSSWHKVVDESDSTDFALEDESGRAIVDGSALSLALDFDASDSSDMFNDGSPELMTFLQTRGVKTKGLLLKRTLRAREGALEFGEKVTVGGSGKFMNDPSAQSGYRGTAKLLHVQALSTGELLATDDRKGNKGQESA
ncbi:MAG: hypothetical protein AB8H86_19525 [Polyangiales bacterium]